MSRSRPSKCAAAALGFFLLLAAGAGFAYAQDDAGLRTVSGAVLNKSEDPLANAVVYLKNDRTLTIKTYISSQDGKYRFSGLDPNVDYEIHAEHDELTSGNHTVSSFDSRKDINVTLKVDKEKKRDK